jgi:hypothetical protein
MSGLNRTVHTSLAFIMSFSNPECRCWLVCREPVGFLPSGLREQKMEEPGYMSDFFSDRNSDFPGSTTFQFSKTFNLLSGRVAPTVVPLYF